MPLNPLPPAALARRTDPRTLESGTGEQSSVAVSAHEPAAGASTDQAAFAQERARRAIAFGLGAAMPGFNLVVGGLPGIGKREVVRKEIAELVRRRSASPARATARDCVLLHDFSSPYSACAIVLPAGEGERLRHDLAGLADRLEQPERLLQEARSLARRWDGPALAAWWQLAITAIGAHATPMGPHQRMRRDQLEANPIVRIDPDAAMPPVIEATWPNASELAGSLVVPSAGVPATHLLVRAGLLHAASGGFLIIDAAGLLADKHAWRVLKRAIAEKVIRSPLPASADSEPAAGLRCEPVPFDAKVVIIGDREDCEDLADRDPDFQALFRVAVDFDDDLPRDARGEAVLADALRAGAAARGLRQPGAGALARLVDESARLAEHAHRLSAEQRPLVELLVEADHEASLIGDASIEADTVARAIAARRGRDARVQRDLVRTMLEGTVLVDTDGAVVGQVNGLAVYDSGRELFGHPSRITATTRLGDGQLIDIQRETHQGGNLHTRGVLILAAFMGARYAARQPLSIDASLVFEQSYGPMDGDSASVAELCALLSSLSGLPVRQDLAVTGSMDQFGRVQAVGGVNAKIEGFFELCRARGLTGRQGVIVPRANLMHLMLHEEVVSACASGRFAVYAIEQVDEAIELLLGQPAGRSTDGPRTETVAARIQHRLADFTALRGGSRPSARRTRYGRGDRD